MVGIYIIENLDNGNVYVGQSVDVDKRLRYHRTVLRHGYHHNQYLLRAFKKHGESRFNFRLLRECTFDNIDFWEKWYIWYYRCLGKSYNLESGGKSAPTITDEIRKKISDAKKGISSRGRGWTVSEETRAKMSAASRGKPKSKEHVEKIRAIVIEQMKDAPRRENGTFAKRKSWQQ